MPQDKGSTPTITRSTPEGPGRGGLHDRPVLGLALVALGLALVAAIFGFGGIAAGFAFVAKIAFFAFLVLFVVGLVAHLVRGDVW